MSAIDPTQSVTDNVVVPSTAPTARPLTSQMAPEFKSISTMWLLWLFLGGFSAHEFYLGRTGIAFLRLFTLQYLSVGLIIDLFTNTSRVRNYNEQVAQLTGVTSPTAVIIKA